MVDKKSRKKRTPKSDESRTAGSFVIPPIATPDEAIAPVAGVAKDNDMMNPDPIPDTATVKTTGTEAEVWEAPVMERVKVKKDGRNRRDFALPKNPGLNTFLVENTEEGRNKMRRLGYKEIPASEIAETDGVVMHDNRLGHDVVIHRDRVVMACRKEYAVERDRENIEAHKEMNAKRDRQSDEEGLHRYDDDGETTTGRMFNIPLDISGR
ncbi:MAG: hypothetical protein WC455_11885 [Dehalococcoidia bacterium]|jgi:hypothetical protein